MLVMGWSKIQLNLAVGESLNRCMKKKALVVFYVITEVVELSASISFSSFLILITYLSDPEYQLFDKKHLFEALLDSSIYHHHHHQKRSFTIK